MVNAIILSGDKDINGMPKALIKIGSKYMIEFLIKALKDSGNVEKIFIVGDDIVKEKLGDVVDGFVVPGTSMPENLYLGVTALGEDERYCIICTSDIPMVNGEAIRDFILKCKSEDLELGYPIINKELNDIKYPEVKRTYVKMREGIYTGGNLIYLNPRYAKQCERKGEEFARYRKSPLKLGRVLGISFLIRLITGTLSIHAVEKKMSSIFGLKAKAIISEYPEIGNDVDKPSDIEFVSKYLNI